MKKSEFIITEDKKPKKIELTPLEIQIIMDSLEQDPYGLVRYYGDKYEKILKKLNKALGKEEKPRNPKGGVNETQNIH